MTWYLISGFIGFIAGLLFFAKFLDTEEIKNTFNAKVKQKGRGNIMNIKRGEITSDMKRTEVIKTWKSLKL